jgi:large subunit ribosomal protein L6
MEAKFVCFLEIIGVGYKASTNAHGTSLTLKLGFSHDITLKVPPSVRVFCPGRPTLICCTGSDVKTLTQFAAIVRSCRPPEIYKGKGIRYRNEIILQKQGKKK